MSNETECLPCSAGYYCPGTANVVPKHKCTKGFWCIGGSHVPTPVNKPYGTDCPNGSYCPEGTPAPVPCPKGTYQPTRGTEREDDCLPCDAGKYCEERGLYKVSGECEPGYFCAGNASKSTPDDGITGDICPAGSFCVKGSPKPQACLDGTFMNQTGMSN